MMLTQSLPVNFTVIPSLERLARRLAAPTVKHAGPAKATGLAFGDIADASMQATVKNNLQIRRLIK